jgi:hypothetical protein
MKSIQFVLRSAALSLLFTGALAVAAPVTGTVTNKTTGKPAAGDTVVLVDVQASMGEVAKTTTDARGRYTLKTPGNSNYLVRVTHQGAGYFIGAPEGGAQGDIPVYDVAAKVQGVSVEADVLEMETDNGQLKVVERYFVHNVSTPPVTQWSQHSFEVVLPAEAVVSGAEAQRPAHRREAGPGWSQGTLFLQLTHPAGRRRKGYVVPDQLFPALQRRQVQLQGATVTAG